MCFHFLVHLTLNILLFISFHLFSIYTCEHICNYVDTCFEETLSIVSTSSCLCVMYNDSQTFFKIRLELCLLSLLLCNSETNYLSSVVSQWQAIADCDELLVVKILYLHYKDACTPVKLFSLTIGCIFFSFLTCSWKKILINNNQIHWSKIRLIYFYLRYYILW